PGWQPHRPKSDRLSEVNVSTYEECVPYYERLLPHVIASA
ncbi:MAG: hypothetical protein RLZZ01_328, partial [Actinomycetota bacterium]